MFPSFAIDQDGLLDSGDLSSDTQRREAWARKLKRAQEIRRVAEQEYLAHKTREDADFDAMLFLKRMRDIDDDFFLILLMVLAARGANSQQSDQTPVQRIQDILKACSTCKPFRLPPPA